MCIRDRSYKDRKKKVVPIENQFRFKNTHEAIIDKETWDIVQKAVSYTHLEQKFL